MEGPTIVRLGARFASPNTHTRTSYCLLRPAVLIGTFWSTYAVVVTEGVSSSAPEFTTVAATPLGEGSGETPMKSLGTSLVEAAVMPEDVAYHTPLVSEL